MDCCDIFVRSTTKLPNCSSKIVSDTFKLNYLRSDILEAGRFKINTGGIGHSGRLPLYPIVVMLYSGKKRAVP